MAEPTTRQELIDHCLRRLGKPVVDINLDDDQIEDRVDDALQYFAEYHYDGIEKVYLKHQITQNDIDNSFIDLTAVGGVDTSNLVVSVTKLFRIPGDTINMFDVRYQLALNDLYTFGYLDIIHYDQYMRYMNLVNDMLSPDKRIRYHNVTNRLHIDTDMDEEFAVDDFIVMEAYRILDPSTHTEIFKQRLLKDYLTAQLKKQWGQNLIKFEGVQLPGGVSINGRALYDDAVQELERIEEMAKERFELPPDFIVG
jgi:hypothetical protein|tara:strand:- start:171 stop:932 length:762 start_codon:yes stop_codon:yes gene_type:complete